MDAFRAAALITGHDPATAMIESCICLFLGCAPCARALAAVLRSCNSVPSATVQPWSNFCSESLLSRMTAPVTGVRYASISTTQRGLTAYSANIFLLQSDCKRRHGLQAFFWLAVSAHSHGHSPAAGAPAWPWTGRQSSARWHEQH